MRHISNKLLLLIIIIIIISSSCEIIIWRNNSHSENIRVCMRIFTTALRNKNISQILNKNTSP